MSAEIEQPRLKECVYCHEHKPHTQQFFELRKYLNAQGKPVQAWRSQCRICRRNRVKSGGPPRVRDRGYGNKRDEPKYEPGPKPCSNCHSMPWRVAGPRCPCCRLEYAPEARPEMVLRRFDRCG